MKMDVKIKTNPTTKLIGETKMSATKLSNQPCQRRTLRHLGALIGALLLAGAAGCQDGATSEDLTDAGTSGDGGMAEAKPKLVPVSATGHDRFFGVAFDSQGNFYATGVVANSTDAAADFQTAVAKFKADGTLDPSFGTSGYATKNVTVGTSGEICRGIVVQPTGKIVVAATVEHVGAADARDRDVAVVRFNSDGSLDTTFGAGGVVTLDLSDGELVGSTYVADSVWGLTGYEDGRLLLHAAQKRVGGTDTDFAVVRLSADGVRDQTFGTQGVATLDISNRSASPRTTTLLPDGSIIAAGYMNDGTVVRPVLFKLTSSGLLDTTFGNSGVFSQNVLTATTEAYAVAVQGNALVTTGYGRKDATESLDWVSLRVTAQGQLDTSYGTGGFTRLDVAGFADNSRALAVLPDNRLLLVGGGRPTETNSDGMLALLSANGQPDTSFSPMGYKLYDFGGSSDFFWGAAVSPDKARVAIVGTKSVGTSAGNDDGVVMVLPLTK
jgi:uncharacterized delta-60 repeat protein